MTKTISEAIDLEMPTVLASTDFQAPAAATLAPGSPLAQEVLRMDVDSPQFREQFASKVAEARTLIANVATGSSQFTKRNWMGETSSKAYSSINELSSLLKDMNPANQRKLFSAKKLFGKITLWDNFAKYLTRFEKAETSILKLKAQLQSAEQLLMQEMNMLTADKARFRQQADHLSLIVQQFSDTETAILEAIPEVAKVDTRKAAILEQDVLASIRGLKQDALSMQALALAAAKVGDSLLVTGASTVRGCQRMSTLGVAALDIAVGMARGVRTQQEVQEMHSAAKDTIESLITSIGEEIVNHAQKTVDFESNPVVGIEVLQGLIDKSQEASDILSNYRRNSSSILAQNNLLLESAIQTGMKNLQDSETATRLTDALLEKK